MEPKAAAEGAAGGLGGGGQHTEAWEVRGQGIEMVVPDESDGVAPFQLPGRAAECETGTSGGSDNHRDQGEENGQVPRGA